MSDQRQRTLEIRARVTPEERAGIEDAAAEVGQSLPDFLRSAVIGQRRSGAQSQRRPRQLAEALGKLVEIHAAVVSLKGNARGNDGALALDRVADELRAVRMTILDAYGAAKASE